MATRYVTTKPMAVVQRRRVVMRRRPLVGPPSKAKALGAITVMHGLGACEGGQQWAANNNAYPSVEQWRDLVTQMAGDLPPEFLLAWIACESGGNPCSYTSMGEAGLFQLMPPDNINTAGTTVAALRAACVGNTQQRARALTDDEKYEQVRSGIQYVNAMRQVAHNKLDAAGVDWPEDSADFWRFTKLQHAYPGPSARWLANATQQLGHPPASWAEMRSTIPGGYQGVLDNAEWVGTFGEGGGSVLSSLTSSPESILWWLALGGVAWWAYKRASRAPSAIAA